MLKKIIMYISAFLPMFSIMWIKAVLLGVRNVLEKPCIYTWKTAVFNPYLIIELILIIALASSFAWLMRGNVNVAVYTVTLSKVQNRSAEYYLSYYSLFILALIEFSFVDLIDLIVLFLLISVLGIVYIKNELFFINPTINLLKSYIYEVEYIDKDKKSVKKLIVSPEIISEESTIDIDISQFEFTFLHKKVNDQGKRT